MIFAHLKKILWFKVCPKVQERIEQNKVKALQLWPSKF